MTTGEGTTPVVTATGYLPSGPLAALDFGTGAEETRVFDQRYFPVSIALAAERTRTWAYQTDAVGNVLQIAATADCPSGLALSNRTITDQQTYESSREHHPRQIPRPTGEHPRRPGRTSTLS